MKIAIIGSRNFKDKNKAINRITELLDGTRDKISLVLSGGSSGIDTIAENVCGNLNIPFQIIRPINAANKIDYLYRNVEIITLADKVFAFWNGESRGTKFVIDYCKARGKDIEIVEDSK